ncbi:uncharacterized protein Z520_08934 [Fonsecaea multimorphosa CBS 102226]|uniref:G-protein coupled receptors family 1 profile domain-containing protein n=1 Tax=Fonsecaea multimorphosa CBS 102226 TaxID=1442371 RepID=A0A0D2JQ03_9EURO|nr:uncharacterized protein Z520_08934 [Fonsecaea multimorphosa CBS 102226]KIX95417.1 hypothetical protein Z520_08934 [Fonsecaea multimorphosa CBS 102226]OAL20949.1 hypothetical protein AYO22_08369 [Fonsecaea multimorphosa]
MAATSSVSLNTTLDPLPSVLQHGLVAVAFFGLLSLISSVALFTFLTYRLCVWYHRGQLKDGANQFLLLIYNLVLADVQQAMAFALTSVYLSQNKIQVGTTTCWANGWFVSTGDLASGVFILAIALHTYYAVVKGKRVTNKVFYGGIVCLWIFVYLMAIIGVGISSKIYVRAGAWCWIDKRYDKERLWLHYFWIFICMFGTVVTYILIFAFIKAKSRSRSNANFPNDGTDPASTQRAAKYMIIYPVVYVVCTLPLAGGRMAAMTGVSVPYWWFCLAGAAISSCGWLDALLYAVTRHVLIFGRAPPPPQDLGLDTFGWKNLGDNFWGMRTTISGPLGDPNARRRDKRDFLGRSTPRPLRSRQSDEYHFASQPEGVITAKTTIEFRSGPMINYAESDISAIELEDKSERMHSQFQKE